MCPACFCCFQIAYCHHTGRRLTEESWANMVVWSMRFLCVAPLFRMTAWMGSLVVMMLAIFVSGIGSFDLQLKYKGHPFLYFTEENIPELRKMARTTHAHIAKELELVSKTMMSNRALYMPPADYTKFGGHWNELYGNNLAPLALYCVLNPEDTAAFDFAMEFMDIMASHPRWQVITVPTDEVPVAHSLTGFITAFDFLYPQLNVERRRHYMARIFNETKDFYTYTKTRPWGKFYLQNHVATNYLAYLHGCLVTFMHVPKTSVWIHTAVLALERNFKLLNHIVDGSLDEGVAYGSYTSRSFLQYVFLALRHFGIDHSSDTWLQNHIWFYYNTLLPKFQRTVGIADSNYNWFYGPESQLVFLDAYVLQNGNGNWLANEIRKRRDNSPTSPLRSPPSQKWCTLHTEFLWYDPLIAPVPPPAHNKKDLHHFTDWGVVTYSDRADHPNGTYLAFKSGPMHGKAVFDIVQRKMYPWLRGWNSFNPGHEHPDQNMFVFVPNGQPFIADALYGPKLTYLNNVHAFAPSPTSRCNIPWEGQLGECSKWLDWKNPKLSSSKGEVVYAEENDGNVFVSGEAKSAYDPSMKLLSVYRSLILLESDTLLVVDHIETKTSSKLTHVSAFFHNLEHIFQEDKLGETLSGAKVTMEGKDYRVFWITSLDRSPHATIAKESHPSEYRKRQTHFVNVTIRLTPTITRVAFVFLGPNSNFQEVQFMDNNKEGCRILVRTSETYNVYVATRHHNIVSRHAYLGFSGFASIKTVSKEVHFGLSSREMVGSDHYLVSEECYDLIAVCVAVTFMLCFVVCVTLSKLRVRTKVKVRIVIVLMFFIALLHTSVYVAQCPQIGCDSCTSSSPIRTINPVDPSSTEKPDFPSVIVTSLPGSSAEIASWMFYDNPDLLVLSLPSNHIAQPKLDSIDNLLTDVCNWDNSAVGNLLVLGKWMSTLSFKLKDNLKYLEGQEMYQDIFFGNDVRPPPLNLSSENGDKKSSIYKNYTLASVYLHVKTYPYAQPLLFFTTGSWALKVKFFSEVFRSRLRQIHVVRDPRSWIANYLRNDNKLYSALMVERVVRQFLEASGQLCAPNGKVLPEFLKIRELLEDYDKKEPHKLLAVVWKAHTEAVLRLGNDLLDKNLKIVKVEDILVDADKTTREVYDFIGLPVRPGAIQQSLQMTRSSVYHVPYEGTIGKHSLTAWKGILSEGQIKDILDICGPVMRQLEYR
ncbi:Dermatan-sulfate epimerase-like protein [Holothuria leucospilota]|uniref:Dermatan-sulfate epimerase-like protein n=1 Tax=Holothuria leucospilota TaxID=206669 RepID=A0A9Q1HAX9_HOLLE|nr:Dermatan-sulfate epimerase-like protein [Holothuria leucospilota]